METAANGVHQLRSLAFAVVHSTTKVLPAWRETCKVHNMPARLIPRDVKTDRSVDYLRYYWGEPIGFNHDISASANLGRNTRY
jgi:hypothetical protein